LTDQHEIIQAGDPETTAVFAALFGPDGTERDRPWHRDPQTGEPVYGSWAPPQPSRRHPLYDDLYWVDLPEAVREALTRRLPSDPIVHWAFLPEATKWELLEACRHGS
jgi:hypothetical protein